MRSVSETRSPAARRSSLNAPRDRQPDAELRAALGPVGRDDKAVVRDDHLLHDRQAKTVPFAFVVANG